MYHICLHIQCFCKEATKSVVMTQIDLTQPKTNLNPHGGGAAVNSLCVFVYVSFPSQAIYRLSTYNLVITEYGSLPLRNTLTR